MVELFDKDSGASIGVITDAQFRFMSELFEEESETDMDYYISQDTIEMMEDEGADVALLDILREALGEKDDMEITWSRTAGR